MRILALFILFISFSILRVTAQVTLTGLAAYYSFNGNANDLSGNGFNGTIVGPTIDSGYCREGYLFADNYIDCGNPAGNQFDMINDATVCAWVKLTAEPVSYYTLIGKDVSGGSVPKWFFAIYSDSLAFHMNGPNWGGGYWRYSNSFHFSVDSFYHVAVTKTGNNFQFYINAVASGADSFPVNALYVPADMHIGLNEQLSTDVIMDEVYFYDRALSQQEIEQIYTACGSTSVSANFTTSDTVICSGGCVNFINASVNADSFQWYFAGAITTASTDTNASACYTNAGQYDVRLISTKAGHGDTLLLKNYIRVNPLPTPGTINIKPDSVCQGGSSILTVTGSSGIIQWQSSVDSIHFTNISGANDSTYSLNNLSQLTYYRVSITGVCGSDSSAVVAINVFSYPEIGSIILEPNPVCAGQSCLLSINGATGKAQWEIADSTGNYTAIDGADSFVYTAALFQNSDFRVVVSNNICSDTSTPFTVLVNPIPVPPVLFASDSIICPSDSVLITSSGSYADYLWNNGGKGPYTYAGAAGAYWVTVTDAEGCTAISGHQEINVYPVPSVSIVVQGDTLSSFGANSYQWYVNDNPIPDATASVFIAGQSGEYSVQVTDTNGCTARSNNVPVAIMGIIQPEQNNGLDIYPDPFTNTIFIKTPDAKANPDDIEVYNILGELVLRKRLVNFNSSPLLLDVSVLPPGIYFVRAKLNDTEYLKKMLKE